MAREILLVLGANNDAVPLVLPARCRPQSFAHRHARSYKTQTANSTRPRAQALAETTAGLDIRWFGGAPDLSESPLAYKDATKVKAQIARSASRMLSGEIQPQGCIMAGEAAEPAWARARRENVRRINRNAAKARMRLPGMKISPDSLLYQSTYQNIHFAPAVVRAKP